MLVVRKGWWVSLTRCQVGMTMTFKPWDQKKSEAQLYCSNPTPHWENCIFLKLQSVFLHNAVLHQYLDGVDGVVVIAVV